MTVVKHKQGSTAFDVYPCGKAVKSYVQNVSGSAYMKMPFHVHEMIEAGHSDILIKFKGTWKYANKYCDMVKRLRAALPMLTINLQLEN